MAYRWLKEKNIVTIPELLIRSVEKMDTSPALYYFGRKISYEELLRVSCKVSSFIRRNSILDDRIAILMPDIPQFVFAYYGSLLAGRVAVPINFSNIVAELKTKRTDQIKITEDILAQIVDSKPSIIFAVDFLYPILRQIKIDWPCTVVLVSPADYLPQPLRTLYPLKAYKEGRLAGKVAGDVFFWKDILKELSTIFPLSRGLDDVAQFQYTGGTTGIPKGAMLSHRNLVFNCFQVREHLGDVLTDEREVSLGVLPFFHIYGLNVCLNLTLLALRGSIVLAPEFKPKAVIGFIKKHKVTIFPGVNIMYKKLTEVKKLSGAKSLKLCVSGAGSIDQNVCDKFQEITGGLKIVEGYGLSETSPVVSITLPEDLNNVQDRRGFIGRPIPETLVKICGENGDELSRGETGEIIVKGPQVMLGYYGRPEETAEVLKDGWFKTGDVGWLDRNGCLHISDRLKDVIKVNGHNVYASRIEAKILKHPAVAETIVVGIPDSKTDETPVAVVVLKMAGVADKEAVTEELMAWLKSDTSMGNLYLPSRIVTIDSLDMFKSIIGKIPRRKVRDYLLNS